MFAWSLQSLGQLTVIGVVVTALYALPGLAVLSLLWSSSTRPLRPAERFALALGIGVALPPLFLLIFRLIGLRWSASATLIYIGLALAILFATSWRKYDDLLDALRSRQFITWDIVLLVALTFLAVIARLYATRDLPAGLWGDSYQHTMMAQLLVDNGGLFSSWRPYTPLATFTYHFGFHANVAFFHWLTGIPMTRSTVVVGQLLNAFAVPLAYVLISRLIAMGQSRADPNDEARRAVAGLLAAALTGFANTQPAYFTNWGRYTQLAGQIILPVVVVCWINLMERRDVWSRAALRCYWPMIALTASVTACLMLTHYIITFFAALFVGSYLLALILREPNRRTLRNIAVLGSATALTALILALPWVRNTLSGGLVRNTTAFVSGAVGSDRVAAYSALLPVTPFYVKSWILALGVGGLLTAIARREWRVVMLGVWTALLILCVTPQTFGLPGAGVIDNLTGYIALYLTIIPLAGYALATALHWLLRMLKRATESRESEGMQRLTSVTGRPVAQAGLAGVALLGLCFSGLTWHDDVIDYNFQLFTAADEHAMGWIKANIPTNARFLVNTIPAYGGTLVAGSDGGWWIPLLAGRQSTLPPLTYGSEGFERPDYYDEVNGFAARLRGKPLTDGSPTRIDLTTSDNLEALHEAGVTHVYRGAHAAPGPESADHIDTNALRHSSDFRLIYDHDGVLIFELVK